MRGLRSNVGKKQKPSYNDAKILFERQFIVKFLKTPIISVPKGSNITRTGEKQNYNNNNKKKQEYDSKNEC